jgi:hypothetical protein
MNHLTDEELAVILAAMSAPSGFRQGGDYLAVQPVEGSEMYYGSYSPKHESDVATGIWSEWVRLAEEILGVRRKTVRGLVAEVQRLRAALAEEGKESAAAESVEVGEQEDALLPAPYLVFEQAPKRGARPTLLRVKLNQRRTILDLLVRIASDIALDEDEPFSFVLAGTLRKSEE